MACTECPQGPQPGLNSVCSTSLVPHDDPVKGKRACFSHCTGEAPETWTLIRLVQGSQPPGHKIKLTVGHLSMPCGSPCTCHHALCLPFNLVLMFDFGKMKASLFPDTNIGARKDFSSCHGYLWGPGEEEVGERPKELVPNFLSSKLCGLGSLPE